MSSPSSKHRLLDTDRDISPPPLRRQQKKQKVQAATPQVPQAKETPILNQTEYHNEAKALKTQKSIKDFLRRSSPYDSDQDHNLHANKESPLRSFLRRHEFPQLLCLQEVKVAPKDSNTIRAVEKAANEGLGLQYVAHFSLPRDRFNATGWGGKFYGVCALIRSDLPLSATKEVDWDLEGRVLVTVIEEWKFVVINGYWVNGTSNMWRNSVTGSVKGTRHDRKRAFHKAMLEEVKRWEGKGYDVVLVGDMNVASDERDGYPGIRLGQEHVLNRQDFNAKFFDDADGMRGVDTWRYIHGEKRGYTYHGESKEEWGRSCDRVYLGIASRSLVERDALVGADIWESVEEKGGSDHVPLGVALDISKLGLEHRQSIE